MSLFFFFQAEDGIRDGRVTGVQTCALPIWFRREKARHRLRGLSTPRRSCARRGCRELAPCIRFLSRQGSRSGFRSEERRVGKECRFRGLTWLEIKNIIDGVDMLVVSWLYGE